MSEPPTEVLSLSIPCHQHAYTAWDMESQAQGKGPCPLSASLHPHMGNKGVTAVGQVLRKGFTDGGSITSGPLHQRATVLWP